MPWWLKKLLHVVEALVGLAHQCGKLCWKALIWLEIGCASATPIAGERPAAARGRSAGSPAPRGMPRRPRNATNGFSISAMNDATTMISTTSRAARAATHSAEQADRSSTSWTPCGITSGAGGAGGSSSGCARRRGSLAGHPDSACGHRAYGRCSVLDLRQYGASTSSRMPARESSSAAISSAPRAGARCCALLPALRERYDPTFVSSTPRTSPAASASRPTIADELLAAGVDVITLGNHAYRRREIYPYLDERAADPAPGQLPARPARARPHDRRRATASAWR